MGINISVEKVIDKKMEETWSGKTIPYYLTERQDWFDYLRYSGDREFFAENEFEYIHEDIEEQQLVRPKNFNKCREWVKEKVIEGNQQRLLNALNKMEQDNTLCFSWSF